MSCFNRKYAIKGKKPLGVILIIINKCINYIIYNINPYIIHLYVLYFYIYFVKRKFFSALSDYVCGYPSFIQKYLFDTKFYHLILMFCFLSVKGYVRTSLSAHSHKTWCTNVCKCISLCHILLKLHLKLVRHLVKW